MDYGTRTLFISEYGHIEIHLRELMDQRKMNRNMLAQRAVTRFEVVDKWYKGNVTQIDLDILARFCYVLNCNVSDIIEYKE